jgi:hypothetical protein
MILPYIENKDVTVTSVKKLMTEDAPLQEVNKSGRNSDSENTENKNSDNNRTSWENLAKSQ